MLIPKKIQVLTALKNDPATRNIPIILASNLNKSELKTMGLKDETDEYVVKSNISPKN